MSNEITLFDIARVRNNIKNHDFTVADYKVCKIEADTIMRALDLAENIVASWENKK